MSISNLMAGTNSTLHNEFYAPKCAWENIQHLIPKDKILWEVWAGSGMVKDYLTELGYTFCDSRFLFETDVDIVIVSNPPFSINQALLKTLFEWGKPFIMILPQDVMDMAYFHKLNKQYGDIQFIVPQEDIPFAICVDGVVNYTAKYSTEICSFYFCWKMNLDSDLTFLE